MNWLKKAILSKKFIPILLLFFVVQAVVYAATVDYSIPSDEDYHFESIKYYAEQPITTGPFTQGQSPDTIKAVNSIDRNPSYLFHYLLSFPERLFEAVGMSEDLQILTLRFINIALAFMALLVLKKIFDELSSDRLLNNIALAAFVLTGMFVWMAGSINYDNLANLLFLGFIWLVIRLIKKPDWLLAVAAATVGMAMVLSKYSFAPMLLLGAVVSLFYLVKNRNKLSSPFKNINIKTVALGVVFVLASLLFIERIGLNVVQYGAVSPKCDQIFTAEECGVYRVTARNYKQRAQYTEEDKHAVVRDWDPFTHTGLWTYKMYNSLPWYLGHQRIESNIYSEISAGLLAVLVGVSLLFSRKKIKLRPEYKFTAGVTVSYLVLLYLFNLNTYFNIGQMYGYQGRYLLPVLGFFYLLLATLMVNTYRNMSGARKKVFGYIWIGAVALFVVTHFTPLIFLIGTDSTWFDDIPPPYY